MKFRTAAVAIGAALALGAAAPAAAFTVNLSGMSSEPLTNPVGDLSATVTFTVTNCGVSSCDLTLRVENNTDLNGSGVEYDINEVYFNASFAQFNVADLGYVSATKSDSSVVTGGWTFNEENEIDDPDTHGDGFGIHDFSLIDGVGPSANKVLPGQWIDFVFTTPAGVSDLDFNTLSAQTTGGTNTLKTVVLKFVNMDPIGAFTCGQSGDGECDSAYGGTAVPEPGGFALMTLIGLFALAARRRL